MVFFGKNRGGVRQNAGNSHSHGESQPLSAESSYDAKKPETPQLVSYPGQHDPHESPPTMTLPLVILAVCAVGLSVIGTPAWPWFQSFLGQAHESSGYTSEIVKLMVLSSVVVFAGLCIGWWLYGRKPIQNADESDILEKLPLGMHTWFAKKYGIDELYEMTVIRFNAWWSKACALLDDKVWGGAVMLVSYLTLGFAWANRAIDEFVINLGFDKVCAGLRRDGAWLSLLQSGSVQTYLRVIGVALAAFVLFLVWGGGR